METPEDFPFIATAGVVSGRQLKFILARDIDGVLREPGSSTKDRERDFSRCSKILDWGANLLNEKLAKPKYAGLSQDEALSKLQITLERTFDMPRAYRDWILARIARDFQWPGR